MKKYTKKGFILHSHKKEYQSKIKKSITIITKALNENNCYISFSGGKDSTVLTHLALSIKSNTPIWHWDYGDDLMPRPIEKEVLNNLKTLGAINVIVNKRQGSGADTDSGYEQFFGQIKKNKEKYGWNMGLIGVRRDESVRRKHKYISYFQDGDCYPLLDWTSNDIWAYICSNNLKYPSVYDYYGEVLGWDKARFVTFFDPEFETLSGGWDGLLMNEFH